MKEGSEMPRRGSIAKRDVLEDPMYHSKLVTRLINNIMLDGKKGVAQKKSRRSADSSRKSLLKLVNQRWK